MIRLARIFQDGVTLQRRMPIRIWGTSDMHQTVSVALNGETLLENAEIGQTFSLVLPVQEAAENARLSITGTYDTVELERVNIGEVWIAGGQSNMEFLLRYDKDGKTEIASADDDGLRFYDVGEYSFPEEESRSHKDSTGWDKWMTFRPEQAEYFSAVAVYFAKELRRCLGVPVGVVGCNWAGTTASSWTDESWLAADPDLRSYLDDYADAVKDLDMEEYCRRYDETLAFMESPAMAGAMDALLRGKFTLRDLLRFGSVYVEFADTRNSETISVTGNIVLYSKGVDQIAAHIKSLFPAADLDKTDLKRQFLCDDPQCADDMGQPLRADHGQRLRALTVAHRQQKPRQTADMIAVKMCDTDHIDRLKTPALFFNCDLRALTAVYQHTRPVQPHHQRCQPSVGERHHASASEQTNIQHSYSCLLLRLYPLQHFDRIIRRIPVKIFLDMVLHKSTVLIELSGRCIGSAHFQHDLRNMFLL